MKSTRALLGLLTVVLTVLVFSVRTHSQEPGNVPPEPPSEKTLLTVSSRKPAGILDLSVANEATAAITRTLDWFVANQKENGAWSDENFPALTALPLWAFAMSNHPEKAEVIEKAVTFLLSCVREDGGIYREIEGQKGGGLSNYNTAICLTALHATGREDLVPVILNARKFIAGSQHFGGDIYKGGMGYDRDNDRAYTDLLNSVMAFEAMAQTAGVESKRDSSEKHVDLNWAEARAFLDRLQNKEESGEEDAGGFPYRPDESKAGETNVEGRVVFRSYGSMTYAGLLALIYSDVSRDDPRVKSAFDWSVKRWSLEENPGMGHQGQYFFYNILSKSLSAYGQNRIEPAAGPAIDWRAEVIKKVLSLQKIDESGRGYWVNETGRFWESNPVLSSAYAVQALQIATGINVTQ